jgi:hypothetical protein
MLPAVGLIVHQKDAQRHGTTSALTKYNVSILSKGAKESNGKLQENQNLYAQVLDFGREAQNVTGYARH